MPFSTAQARGYPTVRNKLFVLIAPIVLAFVTLTVLSWLLGPHQTSAKTDPIAKNINVEIKAVTETNTLIYLPVVLKPLLPSLLVADFDTCTAPNNLGGTMGAAYNPPDFLRESYVEEPGRGCVAKLEFEIEEWAAFWMKLQNADLSQYKEHNGVITFDIKADQPIPELKLEIKRSCTPNQGCDEMLICYTPNVTSDWQTISLSLDSFYPVDYALPLSAWNSVEELVFTLESRVSGNSGIVYLDDVTFQAQQQPHTGQCRMLQ